LFHDEVAIAIVSVGQSVLLLLLLLPLLLLMLCIKHLICARLSSPKWSKTFLSVFPPRSHSHSQ